MTCTRHLQISIVIFIIVCSLGHSAKADSTECYEMTDGADYRGSTHTTTTGKTCQQWTSQTPHAHSRTPENYPDTGVDDHNFCRNPDGEPNAWCYTTDPNMRWDFCDIGSPGEPCECYEMTDGADYRGSIHTTTKGDTCQKWTSQTPHAHSTTPENYPDTGLGDHNFCRNPSRVPNAWCFTTDSDRRWDYCEIGSPGVSCECYEMTDGADYRGSIHTTTTGKTCQPWTSQTPHGHSRTPENYPDTGVNDHNFCRNPDGEPNAWCYTTNLNTRWELCDIGSPGEPCDIDECPSGQHNCDVDASCSNTIGSFVCTCNDGFEGTGAVCTDIDECLGGQDNCDADASCSNTFGSFVCICNDGFEGTGTGCTGSQPNSEVMVVFGSNNNDGSVAGSGECYEQINGADYRGSINTVSMTGDTQCVKWTYGNHYIDSYPDSGLGDHNFCRNPGWHSTAWCFLAGDDSSSLSWGYCDIGSPGEHCSDGSVAGSGECYEQMDGADYRGSINTVTLIGDTCEKWTYNGDYYIDLYPDSGLGDHNFCRNPDGASTAWCSLAGEDSSGWSWGYCDIGSPGEHCSGEDGGGRIRRNEPGPPPGLNFK